MFNFCKSKCLRWQRVIRTGFSGIRLSHDGLNKRFGDFLTPAKNKTHRGVGDHSLVHLGTKKIVTLKKCWREVLAPNICSEVEVKHSPTTAKTRVKFLAAVPLPRPAFPHKDSFQYSSGKPVRDLVPVQLTCWSTHPHEGPDTTGTALKQRSAFICQSVCSCFSLDCCLIKSIVA